LFYTFKANPRNFDIFRHYIWSVWPFRSQRSWWSIGFFGAMATVPVGLTWSFVVEKSSKILLKIISKIVLNPDKHYPTKYNLLFLVGMPIVFHEIYFFKSIVNFWIALLSDRLTAKTVPRKTCVVEITKRQPWSRLEFIIRLHTRRQGTSVKSHYANELHVSGRSKFHEYLCPVLEASDKDLTRSEFSRNFSLKVRFRWHINRLHRLISLMSLMH